MTLKTWIGDIDGLTTFLGAQYLSTSERRNKSEGAITLVQPGLFQFNEPGEYEISPMFVSGALASAPGQLIVVRDPEGTPFLENSASQQDSQDTLVVLSSLTFVAAERMGIRWSDTLNLVFPTTRNNTLVITKIAD